jgi:DNA end-binding protein Ku
MRALWTGSLHFGLVTIPVKLYAAAEEKGGLEFTFLHKEDLAPVQYLRICKEDGQEVPFNEIVRGYRLEQGDYVVLDDEDFRKADAAKTRLIDIVDFTEERQIDPRLYARPYFLEPQEGAAKAYVLLREALARSGKVGIARFVFRGKEHLSYLKADGKVLLLEQLRFPSELRDIDAVHVPEKKVVEEEVEVARQLIDELTEPFRPDRFHDTYTEELLRVIDEKARGKEPKQHGKEPHATHVQDLMQLLHQSVEQAARRKSPKEAARRRQEEEGRRRPRVEREQE